MTNASHELRYEYIHRVNRAIDYIRTHATDNLDLDNIAKIACVSKYHFHRIFSSQTGETINEFVRRHRLEKAFLKLGIEGDKSITEIALECGFSSSQNFAKAFKKHFNVSPKFVKGKYNFYKIRGIGAANILSEKEVLPRTAYFSDREYKLFNAAIKKVANQKKHMQVNIVEMPPLHLAYVRMFGYDLSKFRPAHTVLYQWVEPRGLVNENSKWILVTNNDPWITPPEKNSFDMSVTVSENTKGDEKVNIRIIPGGKYAVYHCEVDMREAKNNSPASISEEWLRFLVDWLRPSGYRLDSRPCFQIYYNNYEIHPLKYMILDLCFSIRPA